MVAASRIRTHVRSLERTFVRMLGIGPKRLARLVRLRRLLTRLDACDFESLADLAFACGYSDQPHMIHDFKELTGRLPGEADASRPRLLPDANQTRVVHSYRVGRERA
jgi:transcriptional regulator GlxA family with amidase domain